MIKVDGKEITMKGNTMDLVYDVGLFYTFLKEKHPELLDKMIDFVEVLDKGDARIRITKDFKKE